MKKIIAKAILWILGAFAVIFFSLPYTMTWLFSESHEKTWEAMNNNDLQCPHGTKVTTRGWSKAGYSRYCEPMKHGPWEAWSNGHLQVKGEYNNGLEHGVWKWFNHDGTVQGEITYHNGKEIKK